MSTKKELEERIRALEAQVHQIECELAIDRASRPVPFYPWIAPPRYPVYPHVTWNDNKTGYLRPDEITAASN